MLAWWVVLCCSYLPVVESVQSMRTFIDKQTFNPHGCSQWEAPSPKFNDVKAASVSEFHIGMLSGIS